MTNLNPNPNRFEVQNPIQIRRIWILAGSIAS